MAVTLFKLFKLNENKQELSSKLQEWKLIPREGAFCCPKCKTPLKLKPDPDSCDNFVWRCQKTSATKNKNKIKCNTKISAQMGTFFEKTRLSILQVLSFVHLWVMNAQLTFISSELDMSYKTSVDWSSFCREVVFNAFFDNPQKIGGPNKIVEIDKSKLSKRKYYRGYHVEGQWVFGGYERGTGKLFVVAVERRDSDTLLPIIEQWIEKGTTIYSDCWKSYSNLSDIGYQHLTVNHSITFKDADTGVHINSIESSLQHAKTTVLSNGRKKEHVPGNLAKYMFFKKCKELHLDRTVEFFALAGNLYDPLKTHNLENRIGQNEEYFSSEDEEDHLVF